MGLLFEDINTRKYIDILDFDNFDNFYKKAIDKLVEIQTLNVDGLLIYNEKDLYLEMELMKKWYFEGLLRKSLTQKQKEIIDNCFQNIIKVIFSQPKNMFVYKDFNSETLGIKDENVIIPNPKNQMNGILTYDLVSLLKDYHFNFELDDIYKLALYYKKKKGLLVSDDEFIKWFDFMGLQIEMKKLGSFSQLFICEGEKSGLSYIPSTLELVFDISNKYEELKPFTQLLKEL